MAVSTVADICRGALQALGVLASGEVMSAADGDLALELLNGLLDQWAADNRAIYFSTRTVKAITPSDGSYTVGAGGDVDIVRPVFLDDVRLIDTAPTPDLETPLLQLTDAAYREWPNKALENTMPQAWWYNPTFSTARGTLELLPIPTGTTLQFALYSPTAVARQAALTSAFSLPPGYERMLRTNLALELAAPFESQVSAGLAKAAAESMGVVKRANARPAELKLDPAALIGVGHSRWSIYTDQG